jgi:fatty acid desaturase
MKDQAPDYGARPVSYYAGAIRAELDGHPFAAAPSRVGWLALHVALAAGGTFAITRGWGGWAAAVVLALVIGHSFAAMAFVAHEALHGSIVRGAAARQAIGWIGFLPLVVSPTHWVAWHNKAHHGNTMRPGVDPDVFPTLEEYQASRLVRVGHRLTPGAGRLTGLLGLLIGFTTQSFSVLFLMARQRGYLSPRAFTQAIAETLADVAFWGALAFALGSRAFLFAFLIPFAVANVIVMSYILTNHSLSPLTEINDPLLNALSVTVPRPLEILHLGFGMHVEHHIFPAMSPRYARDVRRVLREKFAGRYQSMPFGRAMLRIFRTGRVYKNATTMMDPLTGEEWPTLAPRAATPSGETPIAAAS